MYSKTNENRTALQEEGHRCPVCSVSRRGHLQGQQYRHKVEIRKGRLGHRRDYLQTTSVELELMLRDMSSSLSSSPTRNESNSVSLTDRTNPAGWALNSKEDAY
jgi:hypothetical protein